MKYEVEFKIGDIFKEDDELSPHILRLFAIFNDISMVWKFYLESKKKCKEDSNFQPSFYLTRLMASHLYESFDALKKANAKGAFQKLIEDIPDYIKHKVLKNHYLYHELTLGRIKKDILKPIRNNFFHYNSKDEDRDLKDILTKKKEYPGKIILGDINKDTYFQIVDDLELKSMNELIGENKEKFEIVLKDIYEIAHNMLEFINRTLTKFYHQYMEEKCKIKKVR
jgi:hypothetical protein